MAERYGAGLPTARSWVRIPPVAAMYQRQLSLPSLRGRLMSTSESWGVNGHTTRCTGPVSVVLRLWLRSAPPHGPEGLGKDFYYRPMDHGTSFVLCNALTKYIHCFQFLFLTPIHWPTVLCTNEF